MIDFLNLGMEAFNRFAGGLQGAFGKGKLGKGGAWWHGWHHRCGTGRGQVKMLKFCLVQLYKNGLLDAESFAAIFVCVLPQLMGLISENPDRVNHKLCMHPEL